MKEYKVVVYREGFLGSMILGASNIDPKRFSEFLNSNAKEGWRVITMDKDVQRNMIFFKREAYVVVMEKDK